MCYHRCMTMIAQHEHGQLRALEALFHSLSDSNRLAIVSRLREGEARIADLVADLGLAQSTISAHVACLRDCGLVTGCPEGRQMFYSLTVPELLHLLGDAETILEKTNQAVLDCPIFGEPA
jgi:DNA-binding transcriptional ArsR family regulator